MQANANKLQFNTVWNLITNRKYKGKCRYYYRIKNYCKLLCTYHDSKLWFKEHVSNVCSNANKKSKFTSTGSRTIDAARKLSMARAFILCYFNYCPLVWHFCGSECSKNWEHVQFRALKFAYNDFTATYTELLKVSGTMSCHHLCRKG